MGSAKHEEGPPGGSDQSGHERPLTNAGVEDQICREILAIHHDSYGRGAGAVTAHVLDDLAVVVLDDLELQPSEEFLIDAGEDQAVTSVRDQFQQSIEATFRAVVERATGRRVTAFTSHLALTDSHFSVEVFRLDSA